MIAKTGSLEPWTSYALAAVGRSTLHASGIRLRNTQDWVTPKGEPPKPIAGARVR
ncbi:hypothetical protein MBUL_04088 [Methylobacterium bullatum]|uniref:Uncharacterized protein n=1 Tax=Methylobacterium bullatum TaxID=570505 RepID=A0A679J4I1_9HYPH|nr:hypothetical protein MBUL_04088 [Methylobacterium bullatum]